MSNTLQPLSTALEFYADSQPFQNAIGLTIFTRHANGDISYASNVTMQRVVNGSYTPASLTLRRNEAQALVDALWAAGIRPTEGTGSAGSLAATERHLNDVRHLLAHQLGADLPGVKSSR